MQVILIYYTSKLYYEIIAKYYNTKYDYCFFFSECLWKLYLQLICTV